MVEVDRMYGSKLWATTEHLPVHYKKSSYVYTRRNVSPMVYFFVVGFISLVVKLLDRP